MTPWEARELLTKRDPQRALRAHEVDPLPPKPKPCTCADDDKVEVTRLGDATPRFMCIGACRQV